MAQIEKQAARVNLWTALFQRGWGFVGYISGLAVSAGVPVWAVKASTFLNAYAPASYAFAGLLGATAFSVIWALWGWAKLQFAKANASREFYRSADRINPLETTFTKRRISIDDLVSPIDGLVRGKTFIDCEVLGPAVIIIIATKLGRGSINNCKFYNTAAVLVREYVQIPTGVVFEDCNFLRCSISKVLFMVPEGAYQHFSAGMAGLSWVTQTPRPAALSPD